VSSEDDEILKVAEEYGATPMRRPAHLAADDTSTEAVALHALSLFSADTVMLLQPTSPFRDKRLIQDALALAEKSDHVVAVTYAEKPPIQGAPFQPTGAVYILSAAKLRAGVRFWSPGYTPLVHDGVTAIDIDSEADFKAAEHIACR
jgi:CMP-N-acetylneuraminic acid synthetase